MANKIYLIGAGPGAPDLITVRGRDILRQAEVVIYDYLVDKEQLLETNPGTELICCDSLGKNRYIGGVNRQQEEISKLLVRKAKAGKKVVRLKSGDPFIFGRAAEEMGSLVKKGIEFEVVPGVTAGSAAACFSGAALTDRCYASSVVFVTGHEATEKNTSHVDWPAITRVGTIVLYMGVEQILRVVNELISAGKSAETPVVVVIRASWIDQRTVRTTLGNLTAKIKTEKIVPPAIFIIGPAAELEQDFNWFRKNKKILFTGLSPKRYFLKGTYVHLPMIDIQPLADYREFDRHLRKIGGFDWLVFTSRYGVEYFFKRLSTIGSDIRQLKGISIAVIGNSTKERLGDFGIKADLTAKVESSAGLLEELKNIGIKGKRIFMPRSDISDKGLTAGLKKLDAKITAVIAYKNVKPTALPDIDLDSFDEIMFTSPSGVRNFMHRYGKPSRPIKISCIGEVTLREAKKWNLLK